MRNFTSKPLCDPALTQQTIFFWHPRAPEQSAKDTAQEAEYIGGALAMANSIFVTSQLPTCHSNWKPSIQFPLGADVFSHSCLARYSLYWMMVNYLRLNHGARQGGSERAVEEGGMEANITHTSTGFTGNKFRVEYQ